MTRLPVDGGVDWFCAEEPTVNSRAANTLTAPRIIVGHFVTPIETLVDILALLVWPDRHFNALNLELHRKVTTNRRQSLVLVFYITRGWPRTQDRCTMRPESEPNRES